ncbi:MAG: zf-HC2 domain-containing protein [Planctomycetota bacterium]|mgnify:CR=1 FL=1
MSAGEFKLRSGEEVRCEDVRLAMGEVLDGVADAAVQSAVEAHVRTCPPCATEMNELRTVVEGVRTLSNVPPKPEAWKPVEAQTGGPASPSPDDPGFWDKLRRLFGK